MENGDQKPTGVPNTHHDTNMEYGCMYYYGFSPEQILINRGRDSSYRVETENEVGMRRYAPDRSARIPQGNRNSLLWPPYTFVEKQYEDGLYNRMEDKRYDIGESEYGGKKMHTGETSYGCVHTEADCRRVIEWVKKGAAVGVKKRLNQREKSLIRPGSIFVYSEQESGIRRWTDKKEWSPSRVQGCFLVYRELQGQLLKKTYASVQGEGTYHVVAYSVVSWDGQGQCCEYFREKGRRKGMHEAEIVEERNEERRDRGVSYSEGMVEAISFNDEKERINE